MTVRIVVAITGATGAIYGVRLLESLRNAGVETHLILSRWGKITVVAETAYTAESVSRLADYSYDEEDLAAAPASGSFRGDGMVVAPCSMKTLAGIATGYTDNLVLRAADVTLKERRRLILLARETPLSPIHLENMLKLSRLGVVIAPPVPAFYSRPQSLEEIVTHTVGRTLDQLGLESVGFTRWEGLKE